jgi:hypothetical protein
MQLINQRGEGNKLLSTPVLTVVVPPGSEHHGCCWALPACQQEAQAVHVAVHGQDTQRAVMYPPKLLLMVQWPINSSLGNDESEAMCCHATESAYLHRSCCCVECGDEVVQAAPLGLDCIQQLTTAGGSILHTSPNTS